MAQVAHLEERCQATVTALNAANKSLEELSGARSEFMSLVSHDLKTPLTTVKLFADLLLRDAGEIDQNTRGKYLAVISSEAERASRMIANISDFQNMLTDTVRWRDEEVDLVKLVANNARRFKTLCEAKGIGFSYQSDVSDAVVKIDAGRFSRVVSDLLSHALRVTETGAVKLDLRKYAAKEGIMISLIVTDNGPGISEERLKKIMPPYTADLNTTQDIDLSVACRVIEHYQGCISAENIAGNGAVFRISLPLIRGHIPE